MIGMECHRTLTWRGMLTVEPSSESVKRPESTRIYSWIKSASSSKSASIVTSALPAF